MYAQKQRLTILKRQRPQRMTKILQNICESKCAQTRHTVRRGFRLNQKMLFISLNNHNPNIQRFVACFFRFVCGRARALSAYRADCQRTGQIRCTQPAGGAHVVVYIHNTLRVSCNYYNILITIILLCTLIVYYS